MSKLAKAARWYTVDEVAEFVDVMPATVRTWLKEGYLKGEKRSYGQGKKLRWMIKGGEINRTLRALQS